MGGLICLVVGTVDLVMEDQSTLNLVFLVGSLLVTAWLLAAGVLLRRCRGVLDGWGGGHG